VVALPPPPPENDGDDDIREGAENDGDDARGADGAENDGDDDIRDGAENDGDDARGADGAENDGDAYDGVAREGTYVDELYAGDLWCSTSEGDERCRSLMRGTAWCSPLGASALTGGMRVGDDATGGWSGAIGPVPPTRAGPASVDDGGCASAPRGRGDDEGARAPRATAVDGAPSA
jgi:hypothetical protein